jgi:predicted protein tyrosine phosphatase
MKLLVGPMEEALRLCEAHRPSHLVSWVSPPAEPLDIPPAFGPERRLLLASHDLVEPTEGLEPPSAEHVAELLAFARTWTGARPMLVHCWAGVSRSTAAAFAIACQARPHASEQELAVRLRRLSPTATPNALIVRHADALLGRKGRMCAAIAAIGRGAETVLGTCFALDL